MNPLPPRNLKARTGSLLVALSLCFPTGANGQAGDPEVMCECCYCPYIVLNEDLELVYTNVCEDWLTCHVFYRTIEFDLNGCICSAGPCPDLSGTQTIRKGQSLPGSKLWRYTEVVACENDCELFGYNPPYCSEIEAICEQSSLVDVLNNLGGSFWTGSAQTCGGCP